MFQQYQGLSATGGGSEGAAPAYIPPNRFFGITVFVTVTTCVVAINTPDIELVLGIVGSTIGAVICILFPVSLFIQQVQLQNQLCQAILFDIWVHFGWSCPGTLKKVSYSVEAFIQMQLLCGISGYISFETFLDIHDASRQRNVLCLY